MTQQPEALRLADWLDGSSNGPLDARHKAAAELRRLHQSEREGWRYANELEQERRTLQKMLNGERTESEAHIAMLEKAIEDAVEALELEMKGYADRHKRLMPIVHALRQNIK